MCLGMLYVTALLAGGTGGWLCVSEVKPRFFPNESQATQVMMKNLNLFFFFKN